MFDYTDTGPLRLASSDVLGGGGGGVADRGISSEGPGDQGGPRWTGEDSRNPSLVF